MPRTLRLSGKTQLTRVEKDPGARVARPCRDECRARCVCPVKLSLRVRRRTPAHAWVDVVATNAAHAAFVRYNAAYACGEGPWRTRGSTLLRQMHRTLQLSGKMQLTRASTLARHPARPSRQACRPPKARKVGHGKTTCPLFQVRRRSRPPYDDRLPDVLDDADATRRTPGRWRLRRSCRLPWPG